MNENEKKFEKETSTEEFLLKNWKAFGAVSLGLLLNEETKKEDWLNSVIAKTSAIYSEFEKIEDSFEEDDIHKIGKDFDEAIIQSQIEGASEEEIKILKESKESFLKLKNQELEDKRYKRSSRNKKLTALRKILGL